MMTSKYSSCFLYDETIPPIYGGCGEGSEDLSGVPAEENNFLCLEKVRFNVHSLTAHHKGAGRAPFLGKIYPNFSYKHRKVNVGEHYLSIVFIYLFFCLERVNVVRPRCSLSEG